MNNQSCYESDLVELSDNDVETYYGQFIDIYTPDSFGVSLLLAVCKIKHKEKVNFFLSKGENPDYLNEMGDSPLHELINAVMHNEALSIEIAKLLLEKGANIELRSYMDKTPFLRACCRGSLEMLKLLVKFGCNPDETADDGYGGC